MSNEVTDSRDALVADRRVGEYFSSKTFLDKVEPGVSHKITMPG